MREKDQQSHKHRSDHDRHYRHCLDLFPELEPYSSGFLDVGDGHTLYWEQSGNPDGIPVILLHGGPGAGATPAHRRFFDPDSYRIIIYDQRGSGRSTPLGSVENNTLAHLVADTNALKKHLNVRQWHVFGGSWGSTLALAYAAQFPDSCLSLTLRGIFLCEQDEIDWFLNGMRTIFPEAWDQFGGHLPDKIQQDLLAYYSDQLHGDDEMAQMNAAIRWSLYEGACSSLTPNYETITTDEQKRHAVAMARIECHYFKNQVIARENSLLNHIDTIRSIPATIIQGRYDVICPIKTAYKLHCLWPEADYIVIPDGGHSAMDPPIRSQLIETMEHMKRMRHNLT